MGLLRKVAEKPLVKKNRPSPGVPGCRHCLAPKNAKIVSRSLLNLELYM